MVVGRSVCWSIDLVGADDQLVGFNEDDWAAWVDMYVSKTGWLVWVIKNMDIG
jgi:hypothetical protein